MTEKPKLVFAPGCFDAFEGTQEELDDLIKSLSDAFESGELFEDSTVLDMDDLAETDPELHQKLMETLESLDGDKTPRKLN